jgi:hypothetical protein
MLFIFCPESKNINMYKFKVLYTKTKEYFYLNGEDPIFKQLENIFRFRGDNFQIDEKDFIIEKNLCQGCLDNSLHQLDHCDCSEGCLHDKSVCDFCLEQK